MCTDLRHVSIRIYRRNTISEGRKKIYLDSKLYFQQNWKRFLDDCFIIFIKDESELNLLYATLNNLQLSFEFTIQYDKISLSFLDLMVINKGGKIETDLFYKHTDSKQ